MHIWSTDLSLRCQRNSMGEWIILTDFKRTYAKISINVVSLSISMMMNEF